MARAGGIDASASVTRVLPLTATAKNAPAHISPRIDLRPFILSNVGRPLRFLPHPLPTLRLLVISLPQPWQSKPHASQPPKRPSRQANPPKHPRPSYIEMYPPKQKQRQIEIRRSSPYKARGRKHVVVLESGQGESLGGTSVGHSHCFHQPRLVLVRWSFPCGPSLI